VQPLVQLVLIAPFASKPEAYASLLLQLDVQLAVKIVKIAHLA
jgi:hypothetical protein